MIQDCAKLGDNVAVVWKKEDRSAQYGTEGVVLGILGDDSSEKFLVLDGSTYKDSFKSQLFSLGILDLKIIPMKNVEIIQKVDARNRPPGNSEKVILKIDVCYKSNIEYDSTLPKIVVRDDYDFKPIGNSKSETYGIGITNIQTIKEASINISSQGTVQITCLHEDLNKCIKWIQGAVVLLPDNKRLVLFPTKITYRITDNFPEEGAATEEVIDKIGREDGDTLVFPMGWVHKFFVELDANPLQGLFPGCENLEEKVLRRKVIRRKPKKIGTLGDSSAKDQQNTWQTSNLKYPCSNLTAKKYLGGISQSLRFIWASENFSQEYDEKLVKTWIEWHSVPWEWFEGEQVKGKMVVRDLTINKAEGIYTLDLRKYSGDEFEKKGQSGH